MQQQPVLYRVLPLVPVELDSGERSVAASSDEVLNADDQDGLGSNESRREEMEQDMNLLMEQGFVFSDEEEGSSFDPISTMWPRHPDEFAFSQKGDDENEEGSGGLSGDDEAYREGGDEDYSDEGGERRPSDGQLFSWSEAACPPPVYESFDLRVVYEPKKTGLCSTDDFRTRLGEILIGRYKVVKFGGFRGSFSKVLHCEDLSTSVPVCLKVVGDKKTYFDQALDEVKILKYINVACSPDEERILTLFDYFYHREHLVIVTDLLKENLYEVSRSVRKGRLHAYFTVSRVRRIMQQVLKALAYIHDLGVWHCDIKPENIAVQDYDSCTVKIIDFGSACFAEDARSTYIQSRPYRAPEVILGLRYDGKIDVWSLGTVCIELFTGFPIFQSSSIAEMLAKIESLLGPIPSHIQNKGEESRRYFTKLGKIYGKCPSSGTPCTFHPIPSTLRSHMGVDDPGLYKLLQSSLLSIDPECRLSAKSAMAHPWIISQD